MIIIHVDIIGGSLSGLATSIALKERNKNIDVVVHEKYKVIGYNHEGRRCGEAYSFEGIWKRWKPLEKSVFNVITRVETVVGDKTYVLNREVGTSYMLNRQAFIAQLGEEAQKLGVTLQTNDKIKSIDALDGDYIIDASGCPSTIKRALGMDKGIRGVTYQQTLEDTNCFVADTVKIFFTGSVGYFWIFPRNPEKKEVNFGVGVVGENGYNLKAMLETFKKDQKVEGKINYVTGGLIPAGLQPPLMYKNILFVGDAGVGSFPLSGQGIYRALLSGEIAGTCLARGKPRQYPRIVHQNFMMWDFVGKTFLKINHVLNKIGEKSVVHFYRNYLNFWYALQ